MNRYTNLTPARFNPLSLQEIMMVPLYKQKKHDEMAATLAEQGIFDVNRLNTDDPIISANIENFRNRVNSLRDKLYTGTGITPGLVKETLSLQKDREKFLSKDGIGGKAQAQYDAYKANEEFLQKMYTSGKISEEKYRLGLQKALMDYDATKGVAAGGSYSDFTAVQDQKIMEEAQKTAQFLRQNAQVRETYFKELGFAPGTETGMYEKENVKYNTEGAIQYAVMQRLLNDRNIMADLNQRYQLGILGNEEPEEWVERISNELEVANMFKDSEKSRHNYPSPSKKGEGDMGMTPDLASALGKQAYYAERYGNFETLKQQAMTGNDPVATRDYKRYLHIIESSPTYQTQLNYIRTEIDKNLELTELGQKMLPTENSQQSLQHYLSKNRLQKEMPGGYRFEGNTLYKLNEDVLMNDSRINPDMQRKLRSEWENYSIEQLKNAYPQYFTEEFPLFIPVASIPLKNQQGIQRAHDTMDNMLEDRFENATQANVMKYTWSAIPEKAIKDLSASIKRQLIVGNFRDYEILDIESSTDAAGTDLKWDENLFNPDESQATQETLFRLMSGSKDFEVLGLHADPFADSPAMMVQFTDTMDRTFVLSVGIDKMRNYDNIKSVEGEIIRFVEALGTPNALTVAKDMKDTMMNKDLSSNTTSKENDFSRSTQIKDAMSIPLYNKLEENFGEEFLANIYSQGTGPDTRYSLSIHADGAPFPKTATWFDILNPEDYDMTKDVEGESYKRRLALFMYGAENDLIQDWMYDDIDALQEVLNEIATDQTKTVTFSNKNHLFNLIK